MMLVRLGARKDRRVMAVVWGVGGGGVAEVIRA